jgi:hypothetical protein
MWKILHVHIHVQTTKSYSLFIYVEIYHFALHDLQGSSEMHGLNTLGAKRRKFPFWIAFGSVPNDGDLRFHLKFPAPV